MTNEEFKSRIRTIRAGVTELTISANKVEGIKDSEYRDLIDDVRSVELQLDILKDRLKDKDKQQRYGKISLNVPKTLKPTSSFRRIV